MTFRGHIIGGAVVLDEPAALPDGTEVEVEPLMPRQPATWADVLKDVIGKAEGLPQDSALNHDHYLYGTSKRVEKE